MWSSRWNPRQTPKNGSEAKKKQGLRYRISQKSYLKTNSHRYVAKPESQQREELLIRTLQMATTCSPSSSVPLKHLISSFSEGNIKQTQFNIWQGTVFTLQLCIYTPKSDWKTRRYRTSKYSVHRNIESFNDNICKQLIPSKFFKTISPE